MTFSDLVAKLLDIVNSAIPFVFALAVVVVIWKIAEAWIFSGGDANKIQEGKTTVLIGIIVLTIMTTVWGIVNVLQESLF